MKRLAGPAAERPILVRTATWTTPTPGGAVAVTTPSDQARKAAGVTPKRTSSTPEKPDPPITTWVPPRKGASDGVSWVTTGAAA